MSELVCKKCDVFVGMMGAGVFKPPEDKKNDIPWLQDHCWGCLRHRVQIIASQKPQGAVKYE